MNHARILAQEQPLANAQAIFWGRLVAGVLDAVDGVIAYGTQGLNPSASACVHFDITYTYTRPVIDPVFVHSLDCSGDFACAK
jgi:hypothetical protein